MKIYVYKTSSASIDSGEIRTFESLDDCIRTLKSETGRPEYVVLDTEMYYGSEHCLDDCDWMVEIYDSYRE